MSNQRSSSSSSFNNYTFDFGLPSRSSATRPLKDHHHQHKNANPSPPPPSSSSWTPNKPAWTHQPATAPRSAAPSSMTGDIFGKSWTTTSTSTAPSLGLPKSDPNLFGDLVGAALSKPSANIPLRAAPPRNAFSMGNLADPLPKPNANPARPTSRGSAENLGSYVAGAGNSIGGGAKVGAPPMKSYSASAPGKDPFSSLADLTAKPARGFGGSVPANSGSKAGVGGGSDYSFGEFQNSSSSKGSGGGVDFSFEAFEGIGAAKNGSFGVPPPSPPKASNAASSGLDPLDSLFSSSVDTSLDAGGGSQPFADANDWDLGGEFGGGDGSGTTTELDGLPPPPTGVTATIATNKGVENYKQGQFADAIKWLSWAVVLIEKSGSAGTIAEVLTCRASCYKEVGEYKKAIADCSKVLDSDSKNVSVLVQRALLFESTEKYKLGAEDLRAVLKIDPTNRLAKTTIHRLTQMAG